MIYDVIVVGAGPGGSSAAAFLARAGISTLLLDKSEFPRDKVCGDGLTPQAIYWLERLGCADKVLAETKGCIKTADIYINKEHVLSGGFPDGTIYPDFAILLDRRRLDNILLENAIACGARFQHKAKVRGIVHEVDCVRVVAEVDHKPEEFRGRIIIGADGVSSTVSRAIGNVLKGGALAVSVRAYYKSVARVGAPMKVYFDRDHFPGYGWVFVDDDGFANIGLGYVQDKNFAKLDNLGARFKRFVESDLAPFMRESSQCGPVSGGSSHFYRPKSLVAERVMLIGDAANQADPLNGGGIHKAMESAFCAAEACQLSIAKGDFSLGAMQVYEKLWSEQYESDWRTAEIFMSIAKNPDMRDFSLFLLKQVGKLTEADPRFRDFAGGLFSGVISQSAWLAPRDLLDILPKHPAVWAMLLRSGKSSAGGSVAADTLRVAAGAMASTMSAASRLARNPMVSLDWGLDIATKTTRLAERRVVEMTSEPQARAGR